MSSEESVRVLISVSRVRVLLYWLRDAAPTLLFFARPTFVDCARTKFIVKSEKNGGGRPAAAPGDGGGGARDHERISKI